MAERAHSSVSSQYASIILVVLPSRALKLCLSRCVVRKNLTGKSVEDREVVRPSTRSTPVEDLPDGYAAPARITTAADRLWKLYYPCVGRWYGLRNALPSLKVSESLDPAPHEQLAPAQLWTFVGLQKASFSKRPHLPGSDRGAMVFMIPFRRGCAVWFVVSSFLQFGKLLNWPQRQIRDLDDSTQDSQSICTGGSSRTDLGATAP